MRAVVFERNGGPEVLELQDVPEPSADEGEVAVDVEAVGVNFRDVYEREGTVRRRAARDPGVEGAGVVAGTGERVAWVNVPGSYAERVAARPDLLVPVPDGVSSEVAAAALLQGMTAHYLAHHSYPVQEGDWVVVHAAAGGVGLLLTQLAKLRGGRVIATTSTPEKADLAPRRRAPTRWSATRASPTGSARSRAARAPPRSTTASARRPSTTGSRRSARWGA